MLRNMPAITRRSVESSCISSVAYSEEESVLEIEFRGGAIYEYREVPLSCFEQLLRAPSCGRFFNDAIRDHYQARRLAPVGRQS